MKLLCFCFAICAVSALAQTSGTAQKQLILQTTQPAGTPASVARTTTTIPSTGTGLTAVPTTGVVSGGGTNAAVANTPVLQNRTNLFGQIVGITTNNVRSTATGTPINTDFFGSTPGTAVSGATTVGQTAASLTAPGQTQVTINLQGTVLSEQDRQSILNRFQGLPGFVVVDQLRVATQPSQTVNEAAGASTGTIAPFQFTPAPSTTVTNP